MLFIILQCPWYAYYLFSSKLSSRFHVRFYQLNVSHWHVLCKLLLISSSVIIMLRTYAFSRKKKWVLAVLSITLLALVSATIWVISKELSRLSRRPSLSTRVPDTQGNRSIPPVSFGRPHQLLRHLRSTDSHCNRFRFIKGAYWSSLRSTSRFRTRRACLTFLTSCFFLLR